MELTPEQQSLMQSLLRLDETSEIKWRSTEQKDYYLKMWIGRN